MEKEVFICYSFYMDFSRPDNARLINRLKTLSAIREKENMTRAELSRELLINKVSISEIVDALIKEGLVKESGKLAIDSGRPATLLDIDVRAGKVIGLAIREKGCLIAASDLKGKILRLERFPRGRDEEELKENLHASLERILRNESVSIYGAVIVTEGKEDLKSILPFPSITLPPIEAQVIAERRRCDDELEKMLFIMAGEHISAYYEGLRLDEFGHIRIAHGEPCYCGKNGCLETFFSGKAFKAEAEKRYGKPMGTREILSHSEIIEERLRPLAVSIALATETLGAESTMLIGEYSELRDEDYAALNSMVLSLLPRWKKNYTVFKSIAGESGMIEGACHAALDHFFYKRELLEKLKEIEKL